MLCVSAVFAVARCPSVRLSVRLSATLVYYINTAEYIVKLLFQLGSPPHHSSFLTRAAGAQFQ